MIHRIIDFSLDNRLLVMIGWVFFRTDTLTHAGGFLRSMFGLGGQSLQYPVERYATPTVMTVNSLSRGPAMKSCNWLC